MIGRMIDDFKESTGLALRLTSLALATGLALIIATCFLCAAAFVYVLQNYGLIEACVAGAGVFVIFALITAICYIVRKNSVKERAKQTAKSAMQTAFADPMVVAAGLQVIRTIGIKRLVPILAVGGLALGFLASRNAQPNEADAPAE
ncbi:hypothetical protein [Bradyrhizobium sp. dw_411]|uniref:hypothetical protein n=1 Tax=Bradyrhizobium sp. dw_411 TaxID=2720082 RepID=UPI001BCD8887|nr:hypothetical protein [Bradyrhizobium sp. dw_411]